MITDKKGDLLNDDAPVLVNTVNTVGVMGKGIALAFKNAFPHNYRVYRQACKNGSLTIGVLLPVSDTSLLTGDKIIINFPTKTHWRLPAEYEYVEKGLKSLREWLSNNPVEAIALPALGCGNGGLDWAKVHQMITMYLGELQTDIRIYLPT